MTGVTVEARGLTKRFGTRLAVRDLSFTARQGDVVGLLGPNGAGKTTTIRLLTTVLAPSSGTFSVAGIPSSRPEEIRRRVGVLPESAGFPAHQTGRDYLRYHARLFGMARRDAERAADRLLAEVGLGERAASRISSYSRGMRQRLGIARALVNDPAVVVLDEPTLGLDPAGQRQVMGIVRGIARGRGATVLLSTHTLPEVEEVCTAVLIMRHGTVVAAGTLDEIALAAAVRRSGRMRVPHDLAGRARAALAGVPGLAVDPAGETPDVLVFSRQAGVSRPHESGPDAGPDSPADSGMDTALRAVLDAGVPVLFFEVEGARLGDAFLAMTGAEAR